LGKSFYRFGNTILNSAFPQRIANRAGAVAPGIKLDLHNNIVAEKGIAA
jgi:hypothetical protein